MIKRKEKALLIEFMEWKTAKDRLHDRLLWQDVVNTAIKKRLIFQGAPMQRRLLN